jgi:hypothetical protein
VGLDAASIDNVDLPRANGVRVVPAPSLQLLSLPQGRLQLQLKGQAGQEYVVEASSDLLNWHSVSTNVAVEGVIEVIDPEANTVPFRYYRAIAR